MSDLIKRLEAATEGSRELDLEIAVIDGWIAPAEGERYWTAPNNQTRCYEDLVPRYTTSMEAAMELIGDEWRHRGIISWPGYQDGILIAKARCTIEHQLSSGGGPKTTGFANTIPLAICCAALKAKENIY